MIFNIIATFRNNESYLSNFLLPLLKTLEIDYNFYYYFYENDSEDNTRSLLEDFMKGKNGEFKYEDFNSKKHPRNLDKTRIQNIVNARNQYLNLRPYKGEWSIMIDSDVTFSLNIIDQFLKIKKPKDLVALGCNGKDSNKCKTNPNDNHFYDTLGLMDKKNFLGLDFLWKYGFQSCPFEDEDDKKKWFNGELVKVNSGYGGVCFFKTEILNKPELKYELKTIKEGTYAPDKILVCEHWDFSKKLRKFGNIYMCPTIIVRNTE